MNTICSLYRDRGRRGNVGKWKSWGGQCGGCFFLPFRTQTVHLLAEEERYVMNQVGAFNPGEFSSSLLDSFWTS